mmetsp:Transcript_61941/g.151357  ORF Transcript_61941/g.151357 Transcript_61941/m.151357 type:complete len:108 (+) Transcript_61941:617-940(+)
MISSAVFRSRSSSDPLYLQNLVHRKKDHNVSTAHVHNHRSQRIHHKIRNHIRICHSILHIHHHHPDRKASSSNISYVLSYKSSSTDRQIIKCNHSFIIEHQNLALDM